MYREDVDELMHFESGRIDVSHQLPCRPVPAIDRQFFTRFPLMLALRASSDCLARRARPSDQQTLIEAPHMTDLLHYEDVPVGLSFDTGGIDVTEAHIVQFAGLSGDFFDLHMDEAFARELGFPHRVAHGLLCLALVDGLKNRAAKRFASIASLHWEWSFRAPVFAGDRLSAHVEVTDKRLTNKGDRGILTLRITATNQRRALVQDGTNLLLVRTRRACEQTRNA